MHIGHKVEVGVVVVLLVVVVVVVLGDSLLGEYMAPSQMMNHEEYQCLFGNCSKYISNQGWNRSTGNLMTYANTPGVVTPGCACVCCCEACEGGGGMFMLCFFFSDSCGGGGGGGAFFGGVAEYT